jgi:hypothetical protein
VKSLAGKLKEPILEFSADDSTGHLYSLVGTRTAGRTFRTHEPVSCRPRVNEPKVKKKSIYDEDNT